MPDFFAPGSAQTLVLLLMRVGGLVLVAPVFSSTLLPSTMRTALVVLLSVLLHPVALAAASAVPQITPATMITEMLIGFALGLGAAVLIGAASLAGDLMGIQIGLSGAAVFDPLTAAENALGEFSGWFAIALLLAVDGHLLMLDALARSLRALPIGGTIDIRALLPIVKQAGLVFGLGLQFAAPVVVTVLIANTALAILGRAAPQLNILSVAFPIQIGIGLFALTATVPFIGAFYNGWSTAYGSAVTRAVGAFAGGGP
jgi:flagellar biosynthetic protein FliR